LARIRLAKVLRFQVGRLDCQPSRLKELPTPLQSTLSSLVDPAASRRWSARPG
jgi:hypothetical protein